MKKSKKLNTNRIGYADMVADLFHWGHVNFLRQCKLHCDYLIVGIVQDADVVRFKKAPVMTTEERVKVVKTIKYVDEVRIIPLGYYRNKRMLEKLVKEKSINIWFHGDDRIDSEPQEYIESVGGKAIFIPYTHGINSTEVIKRVKAIGECSKHE